MEQEQDYPTVEVENGKVFPSEKNTIRVHKDDTYGGAHEYIITNCLGFSGGQTQYDNTTQRIKFVKKLDDGKMESGLQSEQLVLVLIDRQKKLNARFPSPFNEKALFGLQIFLDAQRARVQDRIDRGVMGELKN